LTLSPEDIRTRIQSGKINKDQDEDGIADVLPALSLMRTGSRSSANHPFSDKQSQDDEDADDYILPHSYTSSALAGSSDAPEADITSANPGSQEPPAMSPDAMLRAYAQRQSITPSPAGGRLEKRPSFIGNFTAALSKRKKKDRDSRQGKPPVSKSILFAVTNSGYPIMELDAEIQTATAETNNPYYGHVEGVDAGVYDDAQYPMTDEDAYGGTA
jgi:hypothetical protein